MRIEKAMATIKQKHIATLQMLACAALWSTGGILMKLVPWNALVLAGVRSAVAAIALLVYIIYKKQRLILNRRTILAALSLSCTYLFFVGANKLTTAANAIVLQFTSPIFIVVFSALFFHKRFRRADVLAVIFTLAGMSLFFLDHLAPGHLLGNLFGVAAGVSMAWMYIFLGEGQEGERLSAIFLGQLLTAVVGLPFCAAYPPAFSAAAVIAILALGIVQLGIPYILFAFAMRRCPPLACSLLGAVEPLLNPVWVLIFNGETPGVFALLGGAAVIATVTVWCVADARRTAA